MMSIDTDRLAKIEALRLAKGAHNSFARGASVMEAVAYVAGEPFSDHPQCASPVVGAFLRAWNDRLDDETRQRLKPYVVRLVGTAGSDNDELRRRDMVWEWVLGTLVPTWLEAAGMHAEAGDVRANGRKALARVREKAWERRMAARERLTTLVRAFVASASALAPAAAAYEAAACAAATYAASAADAASASDASDTADASLADAATSYDAVGAAASAYVDADTDAYAAYATDADNAAAAAYGYVEVALAPIVRELQASAFDLLDRLIDVHCKVA